VSRNSELGQNLSGDFRKNFSSDLNDISYYVGRGRWLMRDGMPYGRIQGQGQGFLIFVLVLCHVTLNLEENVSCTNLIWFETKLLRTQRLVSDSDGH